MVTKIKVEKIGQVQYKVDIFAENLQLEASEEGCEEEEEGARGEHSRDPRSTRSTS